MEHIKIGILEESFLGYSKGAKVYAHFSESGSNMFCILYDSGDEHYGNSLHTSRKPKIAIEQTLDSRNNIHRFWAFYELIRAAEVKIPISFELFNLEE